MASVILAVSMRITRLAALMTYADHIIRNPFAQAFVKDKILSNEFIFEALFFYLSGILDNTTIQLEYIFKADVLHPRTRLLAANTPRAVHHYIFVFFIL